MNSKQLATVKIFNTVLYPLLNEQARGFHDQVQAERDAYNKEAGTLVKLPFALDCTEVLITCADAGEKKRFYPYDTNWYTDNQCVFQLNLSIDARRDCAILLREKGLV